VPENTDWKKNVYGVLKSCWRFTETNASSNRLPESGSGYTKSSSQTRGWYVELEEVWMRKNEKPFGIWT